MGPTTRFAVLDSWRGVCALFVALMHLSTQFLYLPISEAWVVSQFYLFVDFFFVLSGFVIAHAYQGKLESNQAFLRFSVRRFGRLWPLHAAMFSVLFALEVLKAVLSDDPRSPSFGPGWYPFESASNLFLTHALGMVPEPNINGPSWTISAELWTNLLFGIVVLIARRHVVAVLAALGALSVAVLVAYTQGRYLEVTTDYGFFRCLYGFVVGALVYRTWCCHISVSWAGRAEVPVILLVCAFLALSAWQPITIIAPLVFGAAIFVFAYEAGRISNLLRCSPALHFGQWSFSIYLVHWPLFVLLSRCVSFVEEHSGATFKFDYVINGQKVTLVTFDSPFEQLFVGTLAMLLLVGVSAVTYAGIEVPGRSFFNALASSRPPVARSRESSVL